MVAEARHERFTTFLTCFESHQAKARIVGAQKLSQHVHASLLMSTEVGMEAHSIMDNTPSENGLEAWRRLVHRFDPVTGVNNFQPRLPNFEAIPKEG